MEWLIVAIIGGIIGALVGFVFESIRMPQALSILLGVIGGLLGGGLYTITKVSLFGGASFYVYGVVAAVGLLAGGVLAFHLTSEERRV